MTRLLFYNSVMVKGWLGQKPTNTHTLHWKQKGTIFINVRIYPSSIQVPRLLNLIHSIHNALPKRLLNISPLKR
jgi:hypothetical protein